MIFERFFTLALFILLQLSTEFLNNLFWITYFSLNHLIHDTSKSPPVRWKSVTFVPNNFGSYTGQNKIRFTIILLKGFSFNFLIRKVLIFAYFFIVFSSTLETFFSKKMSFTYFLKWNIHLSELVWIAK